MKKNKNDRALGILAPLTCLPGQEGVGTFGKEAYQFVDLLSSHGIKIWQILPLNPIGYGHSPYQPYSSFALDEQFISLEGLYEEGLLSSFIPFPSSSDRIDYEAMHAYKRKELKKAFLQNKEKAMKEMERFKKEKDWAVMHYLCTTKCFRRSLGSIFCASPSLSNFLGTLAVATPLFQGNPRRGPF